MSRSAAPPSPKVRVAVACIIGNFLEYDDFALYGFFAVAIGKNFFPAGSATTTLLSSLAVAGDPATPVQVDDERPRGAGATHRHESVAPPHEQVGDRRLRAPLHLRRQ